MIATDDIAATAIVIAGEGPQVVEVGGTTIIAVIMFSCSLFELMPQMHRSWLRFCEI
jgi:hypothetical protein